MAEFLGVEAEIIDHRPGAARGIARAEIAVDIVLAEPGILDRALGDLGMELRGGFVRRVPGRVFVDPGNVGLAFDGQIRSPLAFLASVFSEPLPPCWQARKYSAGREGSGFAQIAEVRSERLCFRKRHCERSEEIQESSADAFLDCFAALAMTGATGRTLKVFCPTAQAV